MTDALGHELRSGDSVAYAAERWASQQMRDASVVFVRRGLALVRLAPSPGLPAGTRWAGSSQLVRGTRL